MYLPCNYLVPGSSLLGVLIYRDHWGVSRAVVSPTHTFDLLHYHTVCGATIFSQIEASHLNFTNSMRELLLLQLDATQHSYTDFKRNSQKVSGT